MKASAAINILFEQGSGPDARDVQRDIPMEHSLLWQLNYGLSYGLNTLLFGLCRRSKYAMTMEEDWLWKQDKAAVPAIAMAIKV